MNAPKAANICTSIDNNKINYFQKVQHQKTNKNKQKQQKAKNQKKTKKVKKIFKNLTKKTTTKKTMPKLKKMHQRLLFLGQKPSKIDNILSILSPRSIRY